VASRVLYTLALQEQTGPNFITRRLCQCYWGVPTRAVLVTGALMMLAFMGRSGGPIQVNIAPVRPRCEDIADIILEVE
jgi:yeast amino acid transporter